MICLRRAPTIGAIKGHVTHDPFATLTIENGANIKAVSQLLGHARVGTAIKFYRHLSSEFVRQVYLLTNPYTSQQRSVSDIIAERRSMGFQIRITRYAYARYIIEKVVDHCHSVWNMVKLQVKMRCYRLSPSMKRGMNHAVPSK